MATQELRRIGLSLTSIKTVRQKEDWILWLSVWEMLYGAVLTEKSYQEEGIGRRRWWYTHKNIRAGFRLLTHDQNALFIHLTHSPIPTTNNGLEAINGDIKTKLANHRGMTHAQQCQFISWYLTFKKVQTDRDLKRLWDTWRVGQ
jgi:hypothetical protein